MLLLLFWSTLSIGQEAKAPDLEDLTWLIGKWEATAQDSTFSSVLEYRLSPKKKLLMATNQLFGKEGQSFGTYEGAYYVEVDRFAYFIAGPNGETHKGNALVQNDTITHLARLLPGKSIKSYKSQLILQGGKLYYYASYSRESDFPEKVDYSNPLIYSRVE